jgi:prepilin-type N-terminal cleavage/methylation domain-containing protein
MSRRAGFTLVELLVSIVVIAVLAVLLIQAAWKVYANSSLAISADNIRQLLVGSTQYLADHNYAFWPYKSTTAAGATWWFGFETTQSEYGTPDGKRTFDPSQGPLGGYVPKSTHPDPSYFVGVSAFEPKYQNGYLGVGYNVLLGGGWTGTSAVETYWQLGDPGQVVVFATSAQINNFESPASAAHPMVEEFYGFDQGTANNQNPSIRFYYDGNAMVGYATGSAGFLPMDPTTLDTRMPAARIGRFAPYGNTKYLQ